jgi:hypothetical protein
VSKVTNSATAQKSQDILSKPKQVDHKKATELEVSISHRLQMAVRYADIALQYEEIFDRSGFILSTEKFLEFAREVSSKLKELQRVRGVLD